MWHCNSNLLIVEAKLKITCFYFQFGYRVPCFSTVLWAVCIPASCTAQDVENSLQYTISKYTNQTGLKITLQVDQDMCQVKRQLVLSKATIATR